MDFCYKYLIIYKYILTEFKTCVVQFFDEMVMITWLFIFASYLFDEVCARAHSLVVNVNK